MLTVCLPRSPVSAELACLASAFAPHLPGVLAHVSKVEDACALIPDPASSLHGTQPPSSSSQTPTSSSGHSSDNACSWGRLSPTASHTQTRRHSGSTQSATRSGLSSRSSCSLGRQLPVWPEGVSIQEDLALWEPAESISEQASEGASIMAVEHAGMEDASASSGTGRSSTVSSKSVDRDDRVGASGSDATASSPGERSVQLPGTSTGGSQPARMDEGSRSAHLSLPAWDDDPQPIRRADTDPSAAQPKSMAPIGFAFFDSASSDPGTNKESALKGIAVRTEQAQTDYVNSSDT